MRRLGIRHFRSSAPCLLHNNDLRVDESENSCPHLVGLVETRDLSNSIKEVKTGSR